MDKSFALARKRRRHLEQNTSGNSCSGDRTNSEETTPLAGLWQSGHSATKASISPSSRIRQVGRVTIIYPCNFQNSALCRLFGLIPK
jgi:hypothetical protein